MADRETSIEKNNNVSQAALSLLCQHLETKTIWKIKYLENCGNKLPDYRMI